MAQARHKDVETDVETGTETDVDMAREKGVETSSCPTCGSELKLVELPDGGVSTETCSTCDPVSEPEQAAAATQPVRERGTDTTTEEE